MDSTLAISTWLGTLAKTGLVPSAHEEAGLSVAAYVVGEENLKELRTWLEKQPPEVVQREKIGAIETSIWMANADRRLDPEESHMLSRIVMESGLSDDTQDELVAAIHDPPSLEGVEERLTHPVLRELMLALLWELAESDGQIDLRERDFYLGLARRLSVPEDRAIAIRAAVGDRIAV